MDSFPLGIWRGLGGQIVHHFSRRHFAYSLRSVNEAFPLLPSEKAIKNPALSVSPQKCSAVTHAPMWSARGCSIQQWKTKVNSQNGKYMKKKRWEKHTHLFIKIKSCFWVFNEQHIVKSRTYGICLLWQRHFPAFLHKRDSLPQRKQWEIRHLLLYKLLLMELYEWTTTPVLTLVGKLSVVLWPIWKTLHHSICPFHAFLTDMEVIHINFLFIGLKEAILNHHLWAFLKKTKDI